MMTLNDFILIDGIFNHIHTLKPDLPFLGDGQNEVMDRLLILNYGDRLVYRKLITYPANQICEMLVKQHSHKWVALLELESLNKLADRSRTITETTTNNETRNNTRDDKNLISAYNDDSLIINDGSLSVGSDDLTGTETRTMTDSTIDLKNVYNNLSLSDKNNIMNIVLKDVASFITVSIY